MVVRGLGAGRRRVCGVWRVVQACARTRARLPGAGAATLLPADRCPRAVAGVCRVCMHACMLACSCCGEGKWARNILVLRKMGRSWIWAIDLAA
eukprot:359072-Chlamydomonas_euryale.AAC.3